MNKLECQRPLIRECKRVLGDYRKQETVANLLEQLQRDDNVYCSYVKNSIHNFRLVFLRLKCTPATVKTLFYLVFADVH